MSDAFHGAADERAFRHEVEASLRAGEADAALERVRGALATLARGGSALAARCLAVGPEHVTVAGWAALAGRVAALDRPGKPITAIGIDLSNPGAHSDIRPDAAGHMEAYIETNFFSDDAYSFSRSDREALLATYEGAGSEWQGCFVDIDNTISIHGLADVYGPVYTLEQAHRRDRNGGPDFEMAVVGSSYVAILAHVAVRDAVRRQGLPRPMAVLVGSNESYPYFDAPVCSCEEAFDFVRDNEQANAAGDIPLPGENRLSLDAQAKVAQAITTHSAIMEAAMQSPTRLSKAARGQIIGQALIDLFKAADL